ncbi:hypothetical protein [Blastococcus sp. CT_GayMR16]|uniref:hypothetical protein n=1 Tax=Blastococcus sp. CT_GayMR16 TaxID=2559607 RepID=UPI00107350BE|nr:hypothetical protein [Blastococcus sp. CT_GayMR16]TFV89918.1 hypothetical protein E4P38_05560 [Blastococcus sp. CT_GayMR16]
MTDRPAAAGRLPRPAAMGARVLAFAASLAATLALMAGMAMAAQDTPAAVAPQLPTSPGDGGNTAGVPSFGPTTAPPTTTSRAS